MDGKRYPTSPTESSEVSSTRKLEELLKERVVFEQIRAKCPFALTVIENEIARLQQETQAFASVPQTVNSGNSPGEVSTENSHGSAASRRPAASNLGNKKRVKLPIPADKYPEYNFVGRLLGPRGATLKALERETGCKIMIRGKGSIRKDKENEVRGKPGWEHVFNEPLHVVIEADSEEPHAARFLNRAREAIELLLVPVPEENDSLKRQQLRDLAILNGTFRGGGAEGKEAGASISLQAQAQAQARRQSSGMRSSGGTSNSREFGQGGEYGLSSEETDLQGTQLSPSSIDSLAHDLSRNLNSTPVNASGGHEWEDAARTDGEMGKFMKAESAERFASLGSGASYYGGAFSSQHSMVGESLLSTQSSEHTRVQ